MAAKHFREQLSDALSDFTDAMTDPATGPSATPAAQSPAGESAPAPSALTADPLATGPADAPELSGPATPADAPRADLSGPGITTDITTSTIAAPALSSDMTAPDAAIDAAAPPTADAPLRALLSGVSIAPRQPMEANASLPANPVWSNLAARVYTGSSGDYRSYDHGGKMNIANGTLSLGFSMDYRQGDMALISKDLSGSGEGEFTVWIRDGKLVVDFQDPSGNEWIEAPGVVLDTHTNYHLAMSFGKDGLHIFLDGVLVAAEPTYTQGLDGNTNDFVIGASRAWASSNNDMAHSLFRGKISDVMLFNKQLDGGDMVKLAEATDADVGASAKAHAKMAELAPLLLQMHHASDTLQDILAQYGIDHHGHMMTPLKMYNRGNKDDDVTGSAGADGLNGGNGDDVLGGGDGDDWLQGGYGNDTLNGDAGNDVLDGGHGEDTLKGGAGNDLLISRADGREGYVTYDPNRAEGDPNNELTNGKLYPNQPVPADDKLTGGAGADIFYFQTLINAKEQYIEKHTKDDGSVNWHGVAGENDNIHDHWVDVIGNDVITDYSRAEGDRIVIEGHTTEISKITYGDANKDGIIDHSVIHLYSDQGNGGGAHNDDLLGTIKVYGDLVRESDIEHTAAPAYGIVYGIDDLDEALAPQAAVEDGGVIKAPKSALPTKADLALPKGLTPVFAIAGTHGFSGEKDDYMNVGDSAKLDVKNGSLSMGFSLDKLPGDMALLSRDLSGSNTGDFTIWAKNGQLQVAIENPNGNEYLTVPNLVLAANTTYHLGVTFGKDGLHIFLNGVMVAAEPTYTHGITDGESHLVIGASRAWRGTNSESTHSQLEGTVSDVMLFNKQLDGGDMVKLAEATDADVGASAKAHAKMAELAPLLLQMHHASDTLQDILAQYGIDHHGHMMTPLKMYNRGNKDDDVTGSAGADGLNGGNGDDILGGGDGDDWLQGGYGNDTLNGDAGNDVLDGGHGEDTLKGGAGNDLLISRADGREGYVTYDPNRAEGDPNNELTNGKLYPNQPVPADDKLTGGAGADIFYFQTLINAKEQYIEKHTKDDGSVNWHGVAGENDNIHDHWVDVIGNDVITDYSRAEGDRIVIEGHTTEISKITYGDANKDGIIDHSVIHLYSDQGNGGGAHNDDLLGTIKVYGDLVRESDIEHTAAPAYGIVYGIDDLDEALAPQAAVEDGGVIKAPKSALPTKADLALPKGAAPVFAVAGAYTFDASDTSALAFTSGYSSNLKNGTIAFSFTADSIGTQQMLFTKDASDYGDGGHTAIYINELGDLKVRLQDDAKSYYFDVDFAIDAGTSYDVALSFGSKGAELYLNGVRVAYDKSLTVNWANNDEGFVVGASGWSNDSGELDTINNYFDGTIEDVMVFNKQLTGEDIFGDTPPVNSEVLKGSIQQYVFSMNDDGSITAKKGSNSFNVAQDVDFLSFGDLTVRSQDIQLGAGGSDSISGRDGSDVLVGKNGKDYLYGNGNDDLLRGGNGDDMLYGGKGADLLFGQNDDDKIYGGDEADQVWGGDGNDYIYGEAGNDRMSGGLGDDYIYGHQWNDSGNAGKDKVIYDGNFADYSFDTYTWYDSNRGKDVTQLIVTDSANGGLDGYYEGVDRLLDIDQLVFADQTVNFIDLI